MPYLRGSFAKECLVAASTSDKCSGIRCYARRVGEQYLSEGVKALGIATVTVVGSAAVSTAVGVGGAIIGSASRCIIRPPKTYVGGVLCITGTLLSTCAVLPTPAAPYCASAAGIVFYGASKL